MLSTPGPEYTLGEHCTIHPIDTPYPQQIDQILAQILHQRSNPDRRNLSSRAESKNRPPGASTLGDIMRTLVRVVEPFDHREDPLHQQVERPDLAVMGMPTECQL